MITKTAFCNQLWNQNFTWYQNYSYKMIMEQIVKLGCNDLGYNEFTVISNPIKIYGYNEDPWYLCTTTTLGTQNQ
jgi:hypothetical protein